MRDPFHDLHHHETGSTSHIRLISEGGGPHAHTPEPACIDSIQATQSCTTEAQHQVYPSAVRPGAEVPESPVCTLAAEHGYALDREVLPSILRQRLQLLNLRLGHDAKVTVREAGKQWQVADEASGYTLRMVAGRVAVYADIR